MVGPLPQKCVPKACTTQQTDNLLSQNLKILSSTCNTTLFISTFITTKRILSSRKAIAFVLRSK